MPYYSIAMILTDVHLSLNPILGGLFDISLWSLIMMMVVVLLLLMYQESDGIPRPSCGNKTNTLISHYWTPIIVSVFVYLFVVEHQSLLRIHKSNIDPLFHLHFHSTHHPLSPISACIMMRLAGMVWRLSNWNGGSVLQPIPQGTILPLHGSNVLHLHWCDVVPDMLLAQRIVCLNVVKPFHTLFL